MGKAKKKGKKKTEFDDFFDKAPTQEEWLSGVSAAAMDTDDKPAAGQPAAAEAAAEPTGAETMDTTEGPAKSRKRAGLKPAVLKRGQRTTMQQKRKHNKLDRALAVADRMGSKVAKNSSTKHRKASLKSIY